MVKQVIVAAAIVTVGLMLFAVAVAKAVSEINEQMKERMNE